MSPKHSDGKNIHFYMFADTCFRVEFLIEISLQTPALECIFGDTWSSDSFASTTLTGKTVNIYKLLPLSDIWDEMIMFYFFYLLYLNILYTGQLHSLSIFLAKFHMFGILVSRIPNLSPPSPTLYRPGVAGAFLQTPPPLIN